MKCENCYHYEACKSCHEEFNYMVGENLGVVNCPLFEDKSLIVELPCKELFEKIGDSIYCIDDDVEEVIEVLVYLIEFDYKGEVWIKTVNFKFNKELGKELGTEYHFLISEIGKTVFLSREEAERALEEINNEKNNN